MANSRVSMKLLIDNQAKKVLFAEASKECIDFLFHILSLPLAKVVRLLGNQGILRPLTTLYESIKNLDNSYLQPNETKETLLKPICGYTVSPLLVLNDGPVRKKFYACEGTTIFSDDRRALCSNCQMKTTFNLRYEPPPISNGGFVKGEFIYIVMDDLEVKPLSTISSISSIISFKKFIVKDVNSLEEKVVNLGTYEALKLLKATLQSSENVLTDVFMEGE